MASSRPARVRIKRPFDRLDEPFEILPVERLGRDPVTGPQAELEPFDPPFVGVEVLGGTLGRLPRLDEFDVAIGRPHVPEPPAVPVGVGGTPEAEVVALGPVQQVVPALVAGAGPVGDLVVGEPGRPEAFVDQLVLVGLVVVVGWRSGVAASGVPGSTVRP